MTMMSQEMDETVDEKTVDGFEKGLNLQKKVEKKEEERSDAFPESALYEAVTGDCKDDL